MNTTITNQTPWHFWLISAVSLVWNSFGCYDYTMTEMHNEAYIKAMTPPDMIAFMASLPSWLTAFWALGVWGSLAGSVLLLLRSRHAVTAFVVSLVGALGSFGYEYSHGAPPTMTDAAGLGMTIGIFAVIILLWWYARRSLAKGILK